MRIRGGDLVLDGGGVIGGFAGGLIDLDAAADAALVRFLTDLLEVGAALAEGLELARLGMIQRAQGGFGSSESFADPEKSGGLAEVAT